MKTVIGADEYDSTYGSDNESTRSASITSSIVGYKYENGRRYHAYRKGAYYLPNGEAEQVCKWRDRALPGVIDMY